MNPKIATLAIGAIDLPGPQVDNVTSSIDRTSLIVMKPGVGVAIDTSKVNDSRIKDWLSEKVRSNQWIEDPNAPIVLSADMGRGKPK